MRYTPVAFLFLISIAFAFPKPVGFVNDFAHILDAQALEQQLRDYEKATTIEIAVVTIESLPMDQAAATYAVELFQEWGIGKKGEDNGLLVLVVKNGTVGNRMRIEVGYGLQGYVTGAEAGRILDEALPFYNQGDYQKAVEIILSKILKQLTNYTKGRTNKTPQSPLSSFVSNFIFRLLLPGLPVIIFVLVIVVSALLSNRCPYCVRGKIKCGGGYCTCRRCGRKFKKNRRYAPVLIGGFGGGSGRGGFGGFGGGSSGGGGAGR